MLDAKMLAARIREAMDSHVPKLTGADVAKACGVSAQAVSNWRKDGRVHKRHLLKLAEITNRPVEYFVSNLESDRKVKGLTLKKTTFLESPEMGLLSQAWQVASPANRAALLALAQTIIRLDGKNTRTGRKHTS